ncbi:hypothetical protein Tco_1516034 [Tanacetum coccineum]
MVKRDVEIETVGECVDEIDKLAELIGEMQLEQEDRGCVHASNELHLHVVHVVVVEYSVLIPTEYGVSNSLSNTAYSSQLINMAYPLPLDTAYQSSGTETKIIDFRAKKIFFLRANPADIFTLVTGRTYVVEHIAKVLKLVDLIYVSGVDSHQLRIKVFPSMAGCLKNGGLVEEMENNHWDGACGEILL